MQVMPSRSVALPARPVVRAVDQRVHGGPMCTNQTKSEAFQARIWPWTDLLVRSRQRPASSSRGAVHRSPASRNTPVKRAHPANSSRAKRCRMRPGRGGRENSPAAFMALPMPGSSRLALHRRPERANGVWHAQLLAKLTSSAQHRVLGRRT